MLWVEAYHSQDKGTDASDDKISVGVWKGYIFIPTFQTSLGFFNIFNKTNKRNAARGGWGKVIRCQYAVVIVSITFNINQSSNTPLPI